MKKVTRFCSTSLHASTWVPPPHVLTIEVGVKRQCRKLNGDSYLIILFKDHQYWSFTLGLIHLLCLKGVWWWMLEIWKSFDFWWEIVSHCRKLKGNSYQIMLLEALALKLIYIHLGIFIIDILNLEIFWFIVGKL